ncbi:SPX domain-containing membrane protein OsI_21475 [Physcomitrium patens]|uniref:SPX domain-containing protein n=1 Tax=Physcomitrium patens TaxID=3218 RepID=A0A2K1L4D7_PHYPA|nr:SPX domain-containing membrane protein Os06g0129400-like [Physcomitrium patens]XP_024368343.1 SPX domain-containing membrane protein Os06g0129400-like [Physcomitrium patens]XP_024368344.1 SPX domain-containing membrane protein Os06g0129400-like [Physcomitrium patens]XP_024368345.1 SPX domain-containing membrane protein Os06g0129400-like [Physcomitrium patens]XP_024368346.1 SPX domain-containing membrane protein Os06g0129400-like [Physcomitrium patens]XP_024368347.1 SPX domain-containing mem|eukprot:XP_024368342.1 SPX domain-containing membrane protein Os06g0129400-like [Physcomitrella patens]
MVHFGHYILDNQIPGWGEYYIGYKALKKRIKHYSQRAHASGISDEERHEIVRSFSELLDSQVEKIVLFLIERQGLLAERLQRLRKQREMANQDYYDDETGEPPCSPAVVPWVMMDEYRHIGYDLLQLLEFVELNATGIRKILKKFDKRVGFRLGHQYISSRSNHPYSQLQQVFRQVGLGAMVATISRNLAELRQENLETSSTSSVISLFRNSSLPRRVVEKEPVIQSIVETMHRLTREISIQSFVANELLLPAPKEEIAGIPGKQEDYHFMSIQLNLLNTFLYMVNYYIVVPSSDDYAELLHAPATLCGIIIGSMPLAALVSSLIYSWWSNFSYTAPLLISTLILMAGNLMYALALYFNSIWLLLLGRFLCGLGGARAINRRYISDHVPVKQLTSASAAFVSASALGMAVGPALAGALSKLNFKIYGAPVNFVTSPGWLLFAAWAGYFLLIVLFFKEPERPQPTGPISRHVSEKDLAGVNDSSRIPSTLNEPLLPSLSGDPPRPVILNLPKDLQSDEEDGKGDDSDYGDDRAVETVSELMKELTVPIRILLWIYFMLKFASELLISESSILTQYYFNWTTYQVSIFLSLLGLTVLPISAVVGNCISNIYEDRLVVLWTQITTGVGVIAILCYSPFFQYSTYQYVAAAIIIFVSTNVLEGVNMSLLAKVMSPRLSRGVFNCGLLSTEAGTLARALADGMITVAGKAGMENLLNFSMFPTLFIVVFTTVYTWIGYYTLY